MELVKFCGVDEWLIQNLFKGQVFLNHPLNLNDAMEFSFCIKSEEYFEKSMQVKRGLNKYHKEIVKAPGKSEHFELSLPNIYDQSHGFSVESEAAFLKAMYNIVKYEQSEYKVCSFSEAKGLNNPLMWGHYADRMQGVCLRYDLDVGELPIYKVKYKSDQLTPLVYPNRVLNKATRGDAIRKTLRTKKQDWSYEKEWRMIAGDNFVDLPRKALKEVCFGYNCNPDKAEFLCEMIRKEYGESVEFSTIVPDVVRYNMLQMSSAGSSIKDLIKNAKERVESYEHFIQINNVYKTHWKDNK